MSKINTTLAIVIIAVVAAAIGGYIWWQCQQPTSTASPTSEQAGRQQETQQNAQEKAELAGWKTYTNEGYEFEFRYPNNFLLDENEPGYIVSVRGQNDNSGYGSFSVDIRAASVSDVNKDIKLFEKLDNYHKTSIAGNQAFYSTSSYIEDGKKYTEYLIVKQNNTIMYQVLFRSDGVGEKIFSTLKFTE